MSAEYLYDAFISYRHIAPDKPIAERLQKLLETYVLPKELRSEGKKLRLFRDETELPTSSDLGSDIKTALEQSRFLVVICSPEYEKSKWCMQEVTYFKQLHNNSTRQILTLLVGDPNLPPAFPEALRYEPRRETLPDGTVRETMEEIEPLAANVSAETLKQAQKKLKTEFLRIAAPLLGHRFDDLYNREQRRRTQRKMRLALSAAGVLAAATLLSTLALVTINGQKRQIESDARTLRENNTELLLRESQLLEQSGDLYGALESALAAFPADGEDLPVPNGAISRVAALTGAFEPQCFPAVRKISLGSQAADLCLFCGGTRLAAVTSGEVSLWNTEDGKCLQTFRTPILNVAISRSHVITEASATYYATGSYTSLNSGSAVLLDMFRKDLTEETQVGENELYIILDDSNQVQKISPKDGSVLWSRELDSCDFTIQNLNAAEGLPVKSYETLWVLDPETGETIASLPRSELDEIDNSTIGGAFYSQGYLMLVQGGNGQMNLHIFQQEGDGFRFLYSRQLNGESALGEVSLAVRDGTILVAGYACSDFLYSTAFFHGYDLRTGEQKWACEEQSLLTGEPFTGFIDTEHGAGNPWDIGFAVIGDRMFAVNAESGAMVESSVLPGSALNLYYSENGYVFVTNDKGEEYFFILRNRSDETSDLNLFLNRNYKSALSLAGYCNNIYAVAQPNGTAVILYRPIENAQRDVVYQRDDASGHKSVSEAVLNEDGTLAAVKLYDPYAILIVDLNKKTVLQKIPLGEESPQEIAFFGEKYLLVKLYHSVQLYNVSDGKLAMEYTDEDYDLYKEQHHCARAELILEQDDILYSCGKGKKPSPVFDLSETVTDGHASLDTYRLSPSGSRIFLITDQYGTDIESKTVLYVYDREALSTVPLQADGDVPSVMTLDACVWSEDESTVYLLFNDQVLGFDCATGEQVVRASYRSEIADLIMIEDDLCLLDIEGNLSRVRVKGDQLLAEKTAELAISGPMSGYLACTRCADGRTFLQYNGTGWLFDPQSFEIVYEIPDFCGVSEATGKIYTQYYDYLNAYPAFTADQIAARARDIIQ